MQVQHKLDEEKKAGNSWKEAVKMREAALVEGRKILADHMTKVEGCKTELSSLETQFITQRREKGRTGKEGNKKKNLLPRKWILNRFLFRKMWIWRIVMVGSKGGGTG